MARIKQVSYHRSTHSRYPQAINDSKQKNCHDRGDLKKITKTDHLLPSARNYKRKLLKKAKKPRLTKYEWALAESTKSDGAQVKLPEISEVYKSNSTCARCAKTYANIKLAVECIKGHSYSRCPLCFDAIKNNLSIIDFVKQIHYDTQCNAIIRCPVYKLKPYEDLKEFRSYVEHIHVDVGVCRDHEDVEVELKNDIRDGDQQKTEEKEEDETPGENKTREILSDPISSSTKELLSSCSSNHAEQKSDSISEEPEKHNNSVTNTDLNDNDYELKSSETHPKDNTSCTSSNKEDYVTSSEMEILVDVHEGTGPCDSRLVIREIRKYTAPEETEAKIEKPVVPVESACCISVSEVPLTNSCHEINGDESGKINGTILDDDGEMNKKEMGVTQQDSFVNPYEDSSAECQKIECQSEIVKNVKCNDDLDSSQSTISQKHESFLGKEKTSEVSEDNEEVIKLDLQLVPNQPELLPNKSLSGSSASASPAKSDGIFPVIIQADKKTLSADVPNPASLKITIKNIRGVSLSPERSSKNLSCLSEVNSSHQVEDSSSKKTKKLNKPHVNGKKKSEHKDRRKSESDSKKSKKSSVPLPTQSSPLTVTPSEKSPLPCKQLDTKKLKIKISPPEPARKPPMILTKNPPESKTSPAWNKKRVGCNGNSTMKSKKSKLSPIPVNLLESLDTMTAAKKSPKPRIPAHKNKSNSSKLKKSFTAKKEILKKSNAIPKTKKPENIPILNSDSDYIPYSSDSSSDSSYSDIFEEVKRKVPIKPEPEPDLDSEYTSSSSDSDYSDIFEEVKVPKSYFLSHLKKELKPNDSPIAFKSEKKSDPLVVPKNEVITPPPDLYKGMPRLQKIQPVVSYPLNELEDSEPPIIICYVPKGLKRELDNIVLFGDNLKKRDLSKCFKEDSNSKSTSSSQENFHCKTKTQTKLSTISPSKKSPDRMKSVNGCTKISYANPTNHKSTSTQLLSKFKKKYSTKSVMNISDLKLREFSCKKCDKKFSSSYSLTHHESSRHFEMFRFICKLCPTPKGFRDSWNLRRHANSIHKTVIPPFPRESGVVRTLQ